MTVVQIGTCGCTSPVNWLFVEASGVQPHPRKAGESAEAAITRIAKATVLNRTGNGEWIFCPLCGVERPTDAYRTDLVQAA